MGHGYRPGPAGAAQIEIRWCATVERYPEPDLNAEPRRFQILLDEAGTSAPEPVTIVSSVVVDQIEQRGVVIAELDRLREFVPQAFQPEFISHGKDIWNSHHYRDQWSFSDRLAYLCAMMSIPRRLGLPVTVAKLRRDAPPIVRARSHFKDHEFQHAMAFASCIAHTDRNIVRRFGDTPLVSVIAEDVPEMRSRLKRMGEVLKVFNFNPGIESILPTLAERRSGRIEQDPRIQAKLVRDSVTFLGKREEPLLQIADAVAFGFRRYFAGNKFGDQFLREIIGDADFEPTDWLGPYSLCTWWPTAKAASPPTLTLFTRPATR